MPLNTEKIRIIIRNSSKLTQDSVAHKIRMRPAHFSRLLASDGGCNLETAEHIAKALGVDLVEILK